MKNKKAIAMPFNWIFAIIVGGFILFFAIYATTQFIGVEGEKQATITSVRLISLFDPLETGLASGKKPIEIEFAKPVRLSLECDYLSNKPFGMQTLAVSEQIFGEQYGSTGNRVAIKDKYVFAEDTIEGEELNLFSKPFSMSFKVADLTMMSFEDYCFFQAPTKIEKELKEIELKNIQFEEKDLSNCTGVKVCFFDNNKCDIRVIGQAGTFDSGRIIKNKKQIYFVDNLVYAGIFSSPDIYECNVKRLMNKLAELGLIYMDKVQILKSKGCVSSIDIRLNEFKNNALALDSSAQLITLKEQAEEIDRMNRGGGVCKIY